MTLKEVDLRLDRIEKALGLGVMQMEPKPTQSATNPALAADAMYRASKGVLRMLYDYQIQFPAQDKRLSDFINAVGSYGHAAGIR